MRFVMLMALCCLVTACDDYEMAVPVDSVESRTLPPPDASNVDVPVKKQRHKKKRAR